MGYTQILCSLQVIFYLGFSCCNAIQLTAYLSQEGLHGSVSFQIHPTDSSTVQVQTALQAIDDSSLWSWNIKQFPVDYTVLEDRCRDSHLGSNVINLGDTFGVLSLPENGSSEFLVSNDVLTLTGKHGIWGRTLVLESEDGSSRKACGTITVSGDAGEKVAEARFFSPVAGSVYFRWVGSLRSSSIDTLIHTNLYHVVKPKWRLNEDTKHNWKIYTTDILDSEADKARENCNFLQLVFDPVNAPPGKAVGDVDSRVGNVKVSGDSDSSVTSMFHDHELNALITDLTGGQRSLYLVIFDSRHQDSFLACAKIRQIEPFTLKALINSEGVKGQVTLSQRSPFDPTWLDFNVTPSVDILGRETLISGYKIHELPPLPLPSSTGEEENRCLQTGAVYNPINIPAEQGSASQDRCAVGDLSGKHNAWNKEQRLSEVNGMYWDVNLPLKGRYSVALRSLILYRNMIVSGQINSTRLTSAPWICGTLAPYLSENKRWKVPLFTASVVFRYPTVGRIIFRQPRDQPWTDTTVIVESIVHADGTTQNNTGDHRWMIHEFPPGRDFYNWSGRCLSAGQPFNPYKVDFNPNTTETACSPSKIGFCRIGDLSPRHGTLNIAGRKANGTLLTRRLYTDSLLPLSGSASILGRAFVLYDDHGPKARGERLACSPVNAIYRRKAVVKDWFRNSEQTSIKGKIEIFQQTEYDVTDIEIDLEGLQDTSGYHIHMTPVEGNLEFPCEATTLYGHWNPRNVTTSQSLPPTKGTPDQYEMGDLSGKFGLLDGLTNVDAAFNDTDLSLFGSYSILGRSVIVHKKDNNRRWACSTIERGYAPSEARELRAIASFHHPLGFAYGYIRMTQLVYNDGSMSDTVIEVKLRHPGKHDRNVTRNHNWAIYVNPVGVDATVKVLDTRCVAGGYRWNPYYTQLADPLNDDLYREECGPDNPLRCYVGDISGRLGTIDIGDKRQMFTDVNFPLEGSVSAMGRSIVIMNKDQRGERFACANIEPDKDIIKYANLRRPPRFVLAQFIEDVRQVMGIPEWMLTVDSRKTKILHRGGCIQFLIHFKGPAASQLELDFSRLLSTGRLASPSLYVPGYVPSYKRRTTLSYRPCGSRDPGDKDYRFRSNTNSARCSKPAVILTFVMIFILLKFEL